MRVLLIGDVHLADKPPSVRTDTYTEDILGKLEFAVKTAKEQACDAIVQAGDIFHIKSPSKTSHSLVVKAHSILTAEDIPVLIVPGNHDLVYDRLDSIPNQPIGALASMRGVELLMGAHPDLPIYGIPWLHDWSKELPKWMGRADRLAMQDGSYLLVTHAPIVPPGTTLPYEFIDAYEWGSFMGNEGNCYFGHHHEPDGVFQANGVTFCNQGALSRGSLHEASLTRKPAVTVFDNNATVRKFVRIEVPHKPAEEVFKLTEHQHKETMKANVSNFIEAVGKTEIDTTSAESVIDAIQKMDLSSEVREVVLTLVEEVL